MKQDANTKRQIVNKRQRVSLNGNWLFKIDPDGQESLADVQQVFDTALQSAHQAQCEKDSLGLPEETNDRLRAKEGLGIDLERCNPAGGGNGNGHDRAAQNEYQVDGLAWVGTKPDSMEFAEHELSTPVMQVNVPAPWQSQSPDLCYTEGVGWYQRSFTILKEWLEGVPEQYQVILGIDASDYHTEAWLNGIKVGENEGGYLPFEFDASQAIKAGENVLTMRVDDSAELFCEVPHGKQGWYGQLSGIWQPVWLERRAVTSVSQLLLFPDFRSGHVKAELQLSRPAQRGLRLIIEVWGPDGDPSCSIEVPVGMSVRHIDLELQVPEHQPWSPAAPNLYRLEVRLVKGAEEIDAVDKIFGFRCIEAQHGKLYLNGELLYIRGALDQDYYPDTIYSTPSRELIEDQFRKAKELGLNLLRLHIKVPDPIYYDLADQMGLLIWTELPNWTVFSQASGQRGREMLEGILRRDGHHPSIIIWTIINEDWGTDLVNNASHRKWLKETYHWLKALDPTRLVVDNSPCAPNFHIQSDIDDYHFYRGLPDQRREWDEFIHKFASRPDFTYGPQEEITRTCQEPLILSEFGNWGLPDADLLVDAQGADPWWFESGREWTAGVVQPQGVRGRFQRLGLDGVFGSWKSFIKATQEQQFQAMKYELESIRRQPEISGYVITELTDVHWECNGLLDMHRNPKSYQSQLAMINAQTVLIPGWERVAYWSNEPVHLRLSVAHGGARALDGCEVLWRIKGHLWGSMELPVLEPGKVWEMGYLKFPTPTVMNPEIQRLNFELVNKDGTLLASNYLDLVVYPMRAPTTDVINGRDIPIYTTEVGLGRRLGELGFMIVPDIHDARLAITPKVSGQPYAEEVLSFLESGGRLLVLADRAVDDGPVFPGIMVAGREKTPWAGDWASTFSWLKRTGPYTRLPGGPMVDQSFDAVIPKSILAGFKEWEFPRLVQAGIVVGWVHKAAVLVGERRYGKGRVILNTFHLPDELIGCDPTATALLEALISSAATQ
jgi:hypothetical protein